MQPERRDQRKHQNMLKNDERNLLKPGDDFIYTIYTSYAIFVVVVLLLTIVKTSLFICTVVFWTSGT
jgi:hypothetical protein